MIAANGRLTSEAEQRGLSLTQAGMMLSGPAFQLEEGSPRHEVSFSAVAISVKTAANGGGKRLLAEEERETVPVAFKKEFMVQGQPSTKPETGKAIDNAPKAGDTIAPAPDVIAPAAEVKNAAEVKVLHKGNKSDVPTEANTKMDMQTSAQLDRRTFVFGMAILGSGLFVTQVLLALQPWLQCTPKKKANGEPVQLNLEGGTLLTSTLYAQGIQNQDNHQSTRPTIVFGQLQNPTPQRS